MSKLNMNKIDINRKPREDSTEQKHITHTLHKNGSERRRDTDAR